MGKVESRKQKLEMGEEPALLPEVVRPEVFLVSD
jgi:hypothetical protein